MWHERVSVDLAPRPLHTRFWPRGSRILHAPRPRSISVGVSECESVVRRFSGDGAERGGRFEEPTNLA